jgi:general secretion pathway protein I
MVWPFAATKSSFDCRFGAEHLGCRRLRDAGSTSGTAGQSNRRPARTRISEIAMSSRIAALPQTFIAERTTRAPARRHRAMRSGARAGFTLIEAVVALAVVAISLTAIGAVATSSARGTRSIEQHLALMETARIVAATLPTGDQAALDGLSGEILGHRWRTGLSPFVGRGIYSVPDSPWIPLTVVVQVRSPSGAVFGFETVRLQRRVTQ